MLPPTMKLMNEQNKTRAIELSYSTIGSEEATTRKRSVRQGSIVTSLFTPWVTSRAVPAYQRSD